MIRYSEFLGGHGFPVPVISAIISVYVQLLAGLLLLFGYKTKIAAMFFGSLSLFFTGAGKYSVDARQLRL